MCIRPTFWGILSSPSISKIDRIESGETLSKTRCFWMLYRTISPQMWQRPTVYCLINVVVDLCCAGLWRHTLSVTFAWDRCLIDVDPRDFAIWDNLVLLLDNSREIAGHELVPLALPGRPTYAYGIQSDWIRTNAYLSHIATINKVLGQQWPPRQVCLRLQ